MAAARFQEIPHGRGFLPVTVRSPFPPSHPTARCKQLVPTEAIYLPRILPVANTIGRLPGLSAIPLFPCRYLGSQRFFLCSFSRDVFVRSSLTKSESEASTPLTRSSAWLSRLPYDLVSTLVPVLLSRPVPTPPRIRKFGGDVTNGARTTIQVRRHLVVIPGVVELSAPDGHLMTKPGRP